MAKDKLDKVTADVFGPVMRMPYERERVVFKTTGESKTQQAHKDLCDVNKILKRYERTGMLPPAQQQPMYGDVSGLVGDLGELRQRAASILEPAQAFVDQWNASRAKAKPKPDGGGSAPPAASPPVAPPSA